MLHNYTVRQSITTVVEYNVRADDIDDAKRMAANLAERDLRHVKAHFSAEGHYFTTKTQPISVHGHSEGISWEESA